MENNAYKYQLEDYYRLLKRRFSFCIIDYAINKMGQPTVRIQYKIDKLKSFDMFVFEKGFCVSYKPNGKSKCYECLTPNQVASVIERVISCY